MQAENRASCLLRDGVRATRIPFGLSSSLQIILYCACLCSGFRFTLRRVGVGSLKGEKRCLEVCILNFF